YWWPPVWTIAYTVLPPIKLWVTASNYTRDGGRCQAQHQESGPAPWPRPLPFPATRPAQPPLCSPSHLRSSNSNKNSTKVVCALVFSLPYNEDAEYSLRGVGGTP